MATKPAQLPVWCTQAPANRVDPPQAQVETGFVANERPAAETFNALFHNIGESLRYLDESQSTAVLASNLDPSVRLLGGGLWSWALGSTTLAWSESAVLAYPGAADTANTIAAGSAVLPAGYVAFVVANEPFATQGTTTTGSARLTNVVYADVIQVGWTATGQGIPAGTTVTALDADGSSVELSAAATASASGVTLTFAGSGALTVQTAPMASFTPAQNTVVLARATEQTCYVGTGTGQMRLHDGEVKGLLEGGYGDVRRLPAGQTLAKNQFVYVSPGSSDGRTAGSAYLGDANSPFRAGVVGLNVTAHAAGEVATVATSGLATGFSGLTPGAVYYLDPANLGGISPAQPTAAGKVSVPVGTAISTATLLLNPSAAAAASQVPTNLTLSGTLTASSVVSGQGFRQQVDMGGLYVPSTYSFKIGQPAVETGQSLQQYFGTVGANSGNGAARVWTPGNAGSVLNLQFWSSVNLGQPLNVQLYILRVNGAAERQGSTLSNTFYPCGQFFGMWLPFTKGQYTFGNQDAVQILISFANKLSSDVAIKCDMTVEMAA